MWRGISILLFLTLTISRIRGNLAWPGNHLHPVQGLYVKPSVDGTTGDLYVAATEDHGVDTHWLTDQPINFLPGAATETKLNTFPMSLSSSFSKTSSPHEESATTQKRAVITSPQFKYTYALPSSEGSPLAPYPYVAVPVATSQESPPCSTDATPIAPTYPQFSPYHYFYPQMMAAVPNAVTATNDATENGSSTSQTSPYWPGYTYPYQYVMVDPTAWLQGQASVPVTPETSTNE